MGFEPPQPHKSSANAALPNSDIRFPTLAELNAEIFQWECGEEERLLADNFLYIDTKVFAVTRSQAAARERGPSPPIEAPPAPRIPAMPDHNKHFEKYRQITFHFTPRPWISSF